MRNTMLAFLFSILLVPLAGCSAFGGGPVSPSMEYRRAVQTYRATGDLAVRAIDEDFVSLDTAEVIGSVDNAAYAELVFMRENIPTDTDADRTTFDWHLARFRRIIASLRELTSDPGVSVPSTLPGEPGSGDTLPDPNFGASPDG